jgi:hypothetical protein
MNNLDALNKAVGSIKLYDIDEVVSRRALGDLNFTAIRSIVKHTIVLGISLSELPTEFLPEPAVESIWNLARQAEFRLQQLATFSVTAVPSAASSIQARDELMNSARSDLNAFCGNVITYLPYLQLTKMGVSGLINQTGSAIDNIKAEASRAETELVKQVNDKIVEVETPYSLSGILLHKAAYHAMLRNLKKRQRGILRPVKSG